MHIPITLNFYLVSSITLFLGGILLLHAYMSGSSYIYGGALVAISFVISIASKLFLM